MLLRKFLNFFLYFLSIRKSVGADFPLQVLKSNLRAIRHEPTKAEKSQYPTNLFRNNTVIQRVEDQRVHSMRSGNSNKELHNTGSLV